MPVLDPRFPVADRGGQTVSTVKDADGVLDLGWCEGVLSDGRPRLRAELAWAQDQISMLTFFFSVLGLEGLDADAVYALVEHRRACPPKGRV